MKKILTFCLLSLFIFSCNDAEIEIEKEEEIVSDINSVTFQDRVLDNGIPVPGAVVSLYADAKRHFDLTDSNGKYSLVVPAESLINNGFISLNVSHPDYKPLNITYLAPLLANTVYDSKSVSNTMAKCNNCLKITNDLYSELYHLGDDSFSGTVNSQFQKDSDGLEIFFDFTNANANAKLKLNFEAKGLQPDLYEIPSKVIFGDQSIDLEASPDDGSYKVYAVEFDNISSLETIQFKTSGPRPDGDVDDWEITSFYIEGMD